MPVMEEVFRSFPEVKEGLILLQLKALVNTPSRLDISFTERSLHHSCTTSQCSSNKGYSDMDRSSKTTSAPLQSGATSGLGLAMANAAAQDEDTSGNNQALLRHKTRQTKVTTAERVVLAHTSQAFA